MFVDCSYLYTFHKEDLPFIRKFTSTINAAGKWVIEKGRKVFRNPKIIQWHNYLETWLLGESVELYGRKIKPKQIERSVDRVPLECLEKIAGSFTGQDFNTMAYNMIGDGASAGSNPSPNDTDLDNEIARINVITDVGGGALTRDGTTFYSVANFSIDVQSADFTECGIADREKPGTGASDVLVVDDTMGDHSIFPNEVEHEQGQDAVGDTVVIFTCSG